MVAQRCATLRNAAPLPDLLGPPLRKPSRRHLRPLVHFPFGCREYRDIISGCTRRYVSRSRSVPAD